MWAKILLKSRQWKRKFVSDRNAGAFKYKGMEYRINRSALYRERMFLIKNVFVSCYFEGVPDPIVFDEKGSYIVNQGIPIDDVALLFRKIMRGIMDIILIILVVISLLVNIAVVAQVYRIPITGGK